MPGLPRNTHWSYHGLVAGYGEEAALAMLQYMPGLGEYGGNGSEEAAVTSYDDRSHHELDPGGWMPTVMAEHGYVGRFHGLRGISPTNMKGPDGDVGPR